MSLGIGLHGSPGKYCYCAMSIYLLFRKEDAPLSIYSTVQITCTCQTNTIAVFANF